MFDARTEFSNLKPAAFFEEPRLSLRAVAQSLARAALGTALATLAAAGCSTPDDEQYQSHPASLEEDPLDGECSRITWGFATDRYLDAYATGNGNVVTRTFQDDSTQLWCFTRYGNGIPRYTIQHRSLQGQFLDAYESPTYDYRVVLRNAQLDQAGQPHPSQLWMVLGPQIRQTDTSRNVDAYTNSSNDYQVVTRPWNGSSTQAWDVLAIPEPPSPGGSCAPMGSAVPPGCTGPVATPGG